MLLLIWINRDESVNEKEARLTEINSNLSDLEHKLELMQLLQTTEGPIPAVSVKKAELAVTEDQPSVEEDTAAIEHSSEVEALGERKDDSESVSETSVTAFADEEEPPAILEGESQVKLGEEEPDETKVESSDDEVDESKDEEWDQEIEEVAPEPAMEDGETSDVVHDEQVSSEGVSKPKTEPTKAGAVKPSLQQGAPSQAVNLQASYHYMYITIMLLC